VTLVLDHDDICQLLTMSDAVNVIEQAAHAQARGEASFAERANLMLPIGWIRMAPAALLNHRVTGYKEFHLSPSREVRFEIRLFDYETGRPLAAMDGRLITAMRTGASGGVAIRCCTPPSASSFGILGSGESAASQLEAAVAVRPVSSVKVYSRDQDRRERFATAMSERFDISVTTVDVPEKVVEGADVLLVATDTGGQGPALRGEWLHPGIHINSIGSTLPAQREADEHVFELADRIVVDTAGVLRDSGDVLAARNAGTWHEERTVELAELVGGTGQGRLRPDDITLYKSIGTAIQDVAVGHWVFERARAVGLGMEIPDFVSAKPD
jgi:ornithine cyclodeaminase/alanine dehydrogenase